MAIKGKQLEDSTVTTAKLDTATGTVSTINAGDAPVDGTSLGASHKDHQHGVSTAAPPAVSASAAASSEGVAASLMRSDAEIQIDVSGTLDSIAAGQSGSDGVSDGVSRKDHSNAAPVGTAVALTDATNSTGAAGTFADSGHQHAHGSRGGGTLHAAATPSVPGFLSAADKTKLDSLIDPLLRDPKDSVRLWATGNVGLLSGNQTIDSTLTAPGERVAVFQQTTSTEDGIYVTAAGAWSRAADFSAGSSQAGYSR